MMKYFLAAFMFTLSISGHAQVVTCKAKIECSFISNEKLTIGDSPCNTKNITKSDLIFDFDKLELNMVNDTKISKIKKINKDIFLTGNILVYNFSQDKRLMVASIVETTSESNESTSFMLTYECH